MMAMDARCRALIELGRLLQLRRYRFVAVSPSTHNRVLRREAASPTLESVFGWSRPFDLEAIDGDLIKLLEQANALEAEAGQYKSKVRFASIDDLLFVHSAFPTTEPDSVFFGPDTYRFARLLRVTLSKTKKRRPLRLVDIGAGSGAGGIVAARVLGGDTELILADINRKALEFSAVNAALNGPPNAQTILSDILVEIDGTADVIISNPPYLVDEDRRLYRHGGGELGITLALRIAEESMAKLVPGGCLVLYSGAPIVNGADTFLESLQPVLQLYASQFVYEEIDPDVFGEELDRPAYAHADRIAAVGLTAIKRG
jgi:methylase of polypeptide subunit release factors